MDLTEPLIFGGRFLATRLLKKGLGVETMAGTDLAVPGEVIIKLARAGEMSTAAQHRLEHEATVLRGVRSPSLTPLLEFAREEAGSYLVTPFVPGRTLEARLGSGPLSVDETLALGRCLFAALHEAHVRGVLHRDVKPSNVIVAESGTVERATLIDFGFARSARLQSSIQNQPAGTVRYMSPEQAGVLRHEVGPCSDLYSAGVVLFECLAGRAPFLGESISSVLREHLAVRAPELRSLGVVVTRAMDELVRRLLRKDPSERYQSAEAVLADLEEIAVARSRGVAEPDIVLGLHDRRRTISEPEFVGRAAELEAFDSIIERARAGQGGVVVVEAESGGGKSRLLDEFALHAAQRGACTLRGQGLDQIARRPLEMLRGVVTDLVAATDLDPEFAKLVRDRIGDAAAAATTALPELARALGDRPAISLGPEAHGEARTLAALVALVGSLGSAERPAVILLDDCQWADELTLKLLAEREARRDDSHTVIVVAYRSEEIPAAHLLRALTASVRLTLLPLGAADLRRLVESMAGPLPDEVVAFVCERAEGSPFFAAAVLEGLIETGALRASAGGWAVDREALPDGHSSRRAAAVLARRLDQLSVKTRRFLMAAAVLGRKFDLDVAAALSGEFLGAAVEMAREAHRRRLVWAGVDGTQFTFVHDKIREALLAKIRPAERRNLHRRAAARLERERTERTFELAYHYDAAGEPDRAFPHALRAASQARSQHALQEAELYYRIARRGAETADRETRHRIAEGLGEVLMLRGAYQDAAPFLDEARELAPTDLLRAYTEAKIGELMFKRGDVVGSAPIFERALRLIGRRPPTNAFALALMTLQEVVIQAMHTLFPKLFVGRRSLAGAEQDLLEAWLYNRLGYCNYIDRGWLCMTAEHLRQLNVAERYPPTAELAQAYATHAIFAQTFRLPRRALAYGTKALEMRRAQGDIWGQGQSHSFLGIMFLGAGRFRDSIEACREGIRLLERSGDRWEENTARVNLALAHCHVGELAEALDESRRNYELCREIGDLVMGACSLKPWASATGGDLPAEILHGERRRPNQAVQTICMLAVTEAIRLFHHGSEAPAVAVLESAARRLWKHWLFTFHVSDVFPWLATGRRLLLQKAEYRQSRLLRRRAERAARVAVRIARFFRNELPHELREAGLVAALCGRERAARRLLERSLAEAERTSARCERAQTLYALARVGLSFGWAGSAERQVAARAEIEALGMTLVLGEPLSAEARAEPTLSAADRFATLLESGRRIASGLTRETIFDAIRESALALLRGERCVLVEVGADGELTRAPSDAAEPVSSTLVKRAVAAGGPVVFSECTPEGAGDSAILGRVRSSLYVPIFVRGRARVCLYTTHGQVGGLFAEDDERLAGFIAAIAGVALETAEGFAEVQDLTRTLEKRVEERTAQLSEANRELAAKKVELERQNAEIRRATDHKSAFLANMSHEIRTPLNAILGFTRLALKKSGDALPPLQRENLKKAEKSAVDLVGIVNDVLDLSKVEAGKLAVRPERFALGQLIDEVLASAAPLVGERQLKVHKRVLSLPAQMLTDRTRLGQIVLNLVSNAIKFTPSGSVTIEVAHEPATDRVRVAVIDTGVGIAEADRDRIFERFDQGDSAPRGATGGTGLGLAIVRRLCVLMGGTVTLDSTVGRGSTFTVELPRVLEASEAHFAECAAFADVVVARAG